MILILSRAATFGDEKGLERTGLWLSLRLAVSIAIGSFWKKDFRFRAELKVRQSLHLYNLYIFMLIAWTPHSRLNKIIYYNQNEFLGPRKQVGVWARIEAKKEVGWVICFTHSCKWCTCCVFSQSFRHTSEPKKSKFSGFKNVLEGWELVGYPVPFLGLLIHTKCGVIHRGIVEKGVWVKKSILVSPKDLGSIPLTSNSLGHPTSTHKRVKRLWEGL